MSSESIPYLLRYHHDLLECSKVGKLTEKEQMFVDYFFLCIDIVKKVDKRINPFLREDLLSEAILMMYSACAIYRELKGSGNLYKKKKYKECISESRYIGFRIYFAVLHYIDRNAFALVLPQYQTKKRKDVRIFNYDDIGILGDISQRLDSILKEVPMKGKDRLSFVFDVLDGNIII